MSLYVAKNASGLLGFYLDHTVESGADGTMTATSIVAVVDISILENDVSIAEGGGGATSAALAPIVHQTLAATVNCPVGATNGAWGAWTEVWRYTNSTGAEKRYRIEFHLGATASWTSDGGGDRAGANVRIRRMNAANSVVETLVSNRHIYVRHGQSPYDLLSEMGIMSGTVPVVLANGDYLLIDAQGAAQSYEAGHMVQFESTHNDFFIEDTAITLS